MDKAQRAACWEARDALFACLERNASADEQKCGRESAVFTEACPATWRKHFVERRALVIFLKNLEGLMLAGKGALCFLDDEDSRISSLRSAWERLGGEVTDDLAEATFIVCDDPSNPRCAQVLLGGEALVFSSNFVVQCVAQGRVVNGGPFIQHPVPVSVQNNSPGRGKQRHGRRGNSDDNDDDVGSSVEVLLKETPRVSEVPNLDKRTQKQQTTPIARPAKRAAAVKAAAANSSVLKTKSRSRLATAKRDGDEDRSNDELAVRKVVSAKKQRVASSSAAARAPPNGIEQTLRLGVDIGADMDLDDLVAEFSDFFPNENGATVRPIMFKG